ncbi:Phosphoprotein phosphatase PppA [Pseudomonas sp. FEN]|nr:Phosphoprotein phosphatase PppA [Pseudomonas sp. FEN]
MQRRPEQDAEDAEIRDVLVHADPYDVVRSLVHLGLTRAPRQHYGDCRQAT